MLVKKDNTNTNYTFNKTQIKVNPQNEKSYIVYLPVTKRVRFSMQLKDVISIKKSYFIDFCSRAKKFAVK